MKTLSDLNKLYHVSFHVEIIAVLRACDQACFSVYRYLNAIQTMCPHILRYLTTAVITNKDVRKRRQVLKDLVKVIQQVSARTLCPPLSFS